MPTAGDVLRSFIQRQRNNTSSSDGDSSVPPGFFLDDEGNLWPEPEDITPQQEDSFRNQRSIFNPKASVNKFIEGIKYPAFIANPLALRNPVVEAGPLIKEGSLVNPQAVKFLKEFAPKEKGDYTTFESPFGTDVVLSADPRGNAYGLSFEGPFGYKMPSSIKRRMKKELETANFAENQGDLELANNIRDRVINMQEMLSEPLRSPALRYTLGEALESVPVNSSVMAAPIGGEKGARARVYSALTNDAFTTFKGVKPNPELMPTEEEFRQAREGGGFTRNEVATINRDRGAIRSERTGPDTWVNIYGQEKTFNPSTLKDEMIRATYNLPADTDVSNLRSNPLDLFQKTNRIDFTKPVITTESPIYKFRKGLKGGISIGAADLIPSPEAVRDLYAGEPLSALQKTGQNIVQGLPLAAAVGGTVAAAPVLAPLAGAAGTALTVNALGAAGNEVIRQQTGEGVVSKLRQAIGTAPRTGLASRPQAPRPYVQPRLVQTKSVNPFVQQIQNRLGLAQSRFNPTRGEFGLSEILFNR